MNAAITAGAIFPFAIAERERPRDDGLALLMERYCAGDDVAFRALYARAAPRLFAFLLWLARDRALAEELLQESFIKLHRAREDFIRGADPMPWLYTIARRTCFDELRRRRRAHRRAEAHGASMTAETACAAEAEEDHERTLETVAQALAMLPPGQREALVLTKMQGLPIADAAAVLGVTPGAVKLRAHRAYATLRARLPRGEDDA